MCLPRTYHTRPTTPVTPSRLAFRPVQNIINSFWNMLQVFNTFIFSDVTKDMKNSMQNAFFTFRSLALSLSRFQSLSPYTHETIVTYLHFCRNQDASHATEIFTYEKYASRIARSNGFVQNPRKTSGTFYPFSVTERGLWGVCWCLR